MDWKDCHAQTFRLPRRPSPFVSQRNSSSRPVIVFRWQSYPQGSTFSFHALFCPLSVWPQCEPKPCALYFKPIAPHDVWTPSRDRWCPFGWFAFLVMCEFTGPLLEAKSVNRFQYIITYFTFFTARASRNLVLMELLLERLSMTTLDILYKYSIDFHTMYRWLSMSIFDIR